jgi:hypothetical protein
VAVLRAHDRIHHERATVADLSFGDDPIVRLEPAAVAVAGCVLTDHFPGGWRPCVANAPSPTRSRDATG